jgi:O-antigen/teichoic acid export membrane protein
MAAARRSLIYFFAGKASAALSGFIVLTLMLRLLPTPVFGTYVALVAITEIFYLLTNFGLSYFAQRYVPELRIYASPDKFARYIGWLLLLRTITGLLFGFLFVAAGSVWVDALDFTLSDQELRLFFVVLALGALMRFIEELLQALLLQGWAQTQQVVRNLIRLAALIGVSQKIWAIDLVFLLVLESIVAGTAVFFGLLVLYLHSAQKVVASSQDSLHRLPSDSSLQAMRFYFAQVLGQGYSTNSLKLLVTIVLGVNATAAFGFAVSIADLFRNYSPAFLLGGWIRPLMVARFVRNPTAASIEPVARLLNNICLVGLLPFAVCLSIFGHEVARVVAGDKYPSGASLLAPLLLVVCLQAIHTTFGIVCTTVERTSYVLLATAICISSLPITYFATAFFGLSGTVAGMFLSEVIWISVVWLRLKWQYKGAAFFAPVDAFRLVGAALLFFSAMTIMDRLFDIHQPVWWVFASCLLVLCFWIVAWKLSLIGPDQKDLIRTLLKSRAKSKG